MTESQTLEITQLILKVIAEQSLPIGSKRSPAQWRAMRGLSVDELAAVSGVSAGTIRRYEHGRIESVSHGSVIRNVNKLAQCLGCDPVEYMRAIEGQIK